MRPPQYTCSSKYRWTLGRSPTAPSGTALEVSPFVVGRFRRRDLQDAQLASELGTVERLCDSVIVMAQGRTLASGTMAELRANKDVVEAYLVG